MINLITTSLKSHHTDIELAKDIANEHSLIFFKRDNLSLEEIFCKYKIDAFYLVKNKSLSLINKNNNELFFHPGTGLIRTKVMERNEEDILIKALGINTKSKVLDCTGGLLNDSVVISYYLNEGSITTLEKSKELFLIVKFGLATYSKGSKKLKESFKKIEIINIDYNNYFQTLEKEDFFELYDSIYFDPMFEEPVIESSGISKIRDYASYDVISKELIQKALRFTKNRVVVKIRNNNYSFIKSMEPKEILGGSRSSVKYAIFQK